MDPVVLGASGEKRGDDAPVSELVSMPPPRGSKHRTANRGSSRRSAARRVSQSCTCWLPGEADALLEVAARGLLREREDRLLASAKGAHKPRRLRGEEHAQIPERALSSHDTSGTRGEPRSAWAAAARRATRRGRPGAPAPGAPSRAWGRRAESALRPRAPLKAPSGSLLRKSTWNDLPSRLQPASYW